LSLLQEIVEYWNERNGSSAYSEKLFALFQNLLQQLARYPESGGLTDNKRIRYKRIRTYYIYFSYETNSLTVIAICHVKRSPEYIKALLKDSTIV
jgi:toxin YoeB